MSEAPRLTCRLCHRGANEIADEGRYLRRVNQPGEMPAVWECEPTCGCVGGEPPEPTAREIITRAVIESTRLLSHAVAVNALQDRVLPLSPPDVAELERITADLRFLSARLKNEVGR